MDKYIPRYLNLSALLSEKSIFLFGPRQTGKSMLIRQTLKECRVYNLLDQKIYIELSRDPTILRQSLTRQDRLIAIDEIQKIPRLLDEVHLIIEEYGIPFLLTGSSARSLRKKGVNLLGGRARSYYLNPFVHNELLSKFNLDKALRYGTIPSIYFSDNPFEDLKAYAGNYLKEEVAAEGATRNIPAFSRFLEVAALCNGAMINYSEIGNDAQVPTSTVRQYFEILKDTLIATELPAYKKTRTRKAITTSKFYFFDIGVVHALIGRKELPDKTPEFGHALETYIYHELKSYCDYHSIDDLSYWRSTSGFEVDFILENTIAIEVKAKEHISPRDLRGLRALKEENLQQEYIVVYLGREQRNIDGIRLLPWQIFLEYLWQGYESKT